MVGCIARSPGRRILLLALSMEPQGWTDLVAAFVGDWVDSLLRLAEGIPKPERLPLTVRLDISTTQKGFVNLGFFRGEKTVISTTVDIWQFLEHGHSVARKLLSLCKQSGAAEILRPLQLGAGHSLPSSFLLLRNRKVNTAISAVPK